MSKNTMQKHTYMGLIYRVYYREKEKTLEELRMIAGQGTDKGGPTLRPEHDKKHHRFWDDNGLMAKLALGGFRLISII